MPLAFQSLSHGTVAFGFFNIETHMLLLQQLFFFADRFCEAALQVAAGDTATLEGWRIASCDRIGDLHGAIAGQDLSGFIGATYRAFPFPSRPEDFRQSPEGERSEPLIRQMIAEHGVPQPIALARHADGAVGGGPLPECERSAPKIHTAVQLGEYRFSAAGFDALLAYVARGGYPRWRDDRRPAYVERMVARLLSTA